MKKKGFVVFSFLGVYLAGLVLALLCEFHELHVIFGITFTFTSILLLAIIRLYGLKWGAPAALITYMVAVIFLHRPYFEWITLTEVVFIGILLRKKQKQMIGLDAIFWLALGVPIPFFLYYAFYHSFSIEFILLMIVTVTNSLLNTLLADIFTKYVAMWRDRSGEKRQSIYFRQTLFHLSLVTVAFLFILNTSVNSWNIYDSITRNSLQLATHTANSMKEEIDQWDDEDIQGIRLAATIQNGYLKRMVDNYSIEGLFTIVVTDDKKRILTKSERGLPFDRDSSQYVRLDNQKTLMSINDHFTLSVHDQGINVLPTQDWHEANYIYTQVLDHASVRIYIIIPIESYKYQIFKQYMHQFLYLLGFLIMAALLDSHIREISSLVHNFKQKSDKLTESEERLHHLAYYDSLTGLPNRLHFFNYLKELVAAYSDQSKPIAVMFADLNRFKQVNDTLGHAVGDQLLEKVAERFAGSISDTYQVFRLGGDEFVFVFQYENIADVRTHAKHLCESFSEPILLLNLPIYTTISIGISLYPFDGMDFNHIIKNADMAMYAAKEQGESCYVFYNEQINSLLTEKMHLENGLRSAVQMAQFTLYYQPKVCTITGKIVGVEALLRWNHPEYGDVAPDKFIPLAEESGIILDIDKWVLGEACRQMKEWQSKGIPSFTMSVNISAKHFYEGNLLDVIRSVLGESGLEAHYLKLEITEGVFIRKVETVIETITSLLEMGVQISIDDFGTGYSSLTQLQRLPISEVKLDRSFIQGIKEDSRKSSVVKAVIELAHIMSLSVVAEGIETKEECTYLSELHCDELQGYLFSRPLPYDEFEKLIVNWKG